jgi:pimeloyl-ACP methyl ester carboxylesterase
LTTTPTATPTEAAERFVDVAGLRTRLQERGGGPPLLLLHRSTGNPRWLPLYSRLAESFSVSVPDLPGYGHSERPDWARDPRDLAILMHEMLDQEDVDDVHLVGLGFGGFIAAEMATMNQRRLASLVLVGAAGVRPQEGEILDQMLVAHADYVKAGFSDDAAFQAHFGSDGDDGGIAADLEDVWDFSRIMTARLSWSPYMINRRLPALLQEVRTPALLVWGEYDRIVPLDCGRQYERALPNARLEVVEGAGHMVEIEQPERLTRLIAEHAAFARSS